LLVGDQGAVDMPPPDALSEGYIMRCFLKVFFGLILLVAAPVSALADMATPQADAKPLTAAPPLPTDKEAKDKNGGAKKDPDALPQIFTDERKKISDDITVLRKESDSLHAECNFPSTAMARYDCKRKWQAWRPRMKALDARQRELDHKILAWRNAQQGLPPPVSRSDQRKSQNAPKSKPQEKDSILVPSGAVKTPENLY
jgi:hypothetical protein